MTHPLEELAKWHDARALQMNRSGTESGRSQADQHTAFGSILRAAIPNCECGELVRQCCDEQSKHGAFQVWRNEKGQWVIGRTIDVDPAVSGGWGFEHHNIGSGPTLAAAVAAARANGAEGTTNAE